MRIFEALKWINQRGAPLAVLTLLFGVAMLVHRMASVAVVMPYSRAIRLEPLPEARLRVIGYVDNRSLMVVVYGAVFAFSLLWLQFRQSPRWSLWLTFAALTLPVLGYMWLCLSAWPLG